MVYAAPPSASAPTTPGAAPSSFPVLGARPSHRRQRSHNVPVEPQGPGAFGSLGSLPRRKSSRKAFFLEDESPSPEPEEEEERASPLSPLTINTNVRTFSPMPGLPPQSVPFPRTSSDPLSPLGGPGSRPSYSPRPSFSRTPSSPVIMLSNGKPLKPSLKSSASVPDIPDELRVHSRAKSEPSTPSVKSVHFRDEDEIEEVRVYNRTGRPANLLLKAGEETETETEVENAFPFPRTLGGAGSPMTPPPADVLHFELDPTSGATSTVPRPNPDLYANIHLESISLPKTRPAAIRGSVLVRNVAFEKHVAVRFTFDDWQTTSEVFCKHVVSLPGLPPPFPRAQTVGDAVGQIAHQSQGPSEDAPAWDRFSFQIRLEDYAARLNSKTLWLVARYTAPGTGEWWDNNAHANYRIGFRKAAPAAPVPDAKNNVRQQGSFVAPSTLRATPQSGSPLSLYSTPAAAVLDANSTFTASPRASPGASPRQSPNLSPNTSTTDVRSHVRLKPKMGLGLGLGVNGSSRPPQLTRSMSSPPVFSPPIGAGAGGFISHAPPATRGAPVGRQQVDGTNLSPLMARLSRLSLSNYSAPSRPVAVSEAERKEDEKSGPSSPADSKKMVGGHYATQVTPPGTGTPVPALQVTVPTPPATAETPKASTFELVASPVVSNESSPMGSRSGSAETLMPGALSMDDPLSTSPVAASSTSTSATSSPLLATPSQSSLTDIPALASGPPAPMWNAPFKRSDSPPKSGQDGSGSGSDSSSTTTSKAQRLVAPQPIARPSFSLGYPPAPLNLPRGDPGLPFSPIPTPRYSLDAALMTSAGPGRDSPTRARAGGVNPGGADYAALVREWCFARSPSPTPVGTPQEEHPVHVRVQATVAVPRAESPMRRETPRGSPKPSPPVNAASGWLGISDGYGFGMGMVGERRSGWEAGKA